MFGKINQDFLGSLMTSCFTLHTEVMTFLFTIRLMCSIKSLSASVPAGSEVCADAQEKQLFRSRSLLSQSLFSIGLMIWRR